MYGLYENFYLWFYWCLVLNSRVISAPKALQYVAAASKLFLT